MDEITRVSKDGSEYHVPAPLVHKVLWGIVSSIIGIGAYMIIWAWNDAAWKASTDSRFRSVETAITELKGVVASGILPRTDERIRSLDDRLDKVEEQHMQMQQLLERSRLEREERELRQLRERR